MRSAALFLISWAKCEHYSCVLSGSNSEYCFFLFYSQTTIIGIEYDGGVVLGSDSRVSAG